MDAFEDADIVYDFTGDPSFEKWTFATEADWSIEDGALVRGAPLDEKGPPTRDQFATAILDVDLSGDYEITDRTTRTSIDQVTYLAKVRSTDIHFAISYDGGLTFESLLEWEAQEGFVPRFGITARYTALRVEAVTVRK